jgi:NADH-quinone oxidoreductase subunit E
MAVLSEELRSKADEIVARYPQPRSALLPLLYLVQAEQGYVSQEGVREVADLLGLTTAEVDAVATYYTMFKKEPTGSWLVSVCTNLSCALAGGRRLYDRAVDRLDQQSPDGEEAPVAVEEVECLGACDAAPVVQVNYCNYDRVSDEGLEEILDELGAGRVPEPSRGPAPVDHRETSRLLGGVGERG